MTSLPRPRPLIYAARRHHRGYRLRDPMLRNRAARWRARRSVITAGAREPPRGIPIPSTTARDVPASYPIRSAARPPCYSRLPHHLGYQHRLRWPDRSRQLLLRDCWPNFRPVSQPVAALACRLESESPRVVPPNLFAVPRFPLCRRRDAADCASSWRLAASAPAAVVVMGGFHPQCCYGCSTNI